MKMQVAVLYLAISATLLAQGATGAASAGSNTNAASAKVASLNFMGGHWEGHVDKDTVEQSCSVSDPAVMVCMFQFRDEKGTQMVEFYTLRDTPSGVEERVRFYSPDLKEEPGDGLTMKLASSTPTTFIFENPNGTYPKRSTLTRTSENEFHSHIELIDKDGKASSIDAYWKKTK